MNDGSGSYQDWRALEQAIKEAARSAARRAGPGVSAAAVDAQIRQARFDRFLCRVFAQGDESEWLLKGGMGMLARIPRSRATRDIDLASTREDDLAEAGKALENLVAVELGDHLIFRLSRSSPTGLGDNQPGVATRRLVFTCLDIDHDTQVDTVAVDVVVGPPPTGSIEMIEPANRIQLGRPLVTYPYRLYPVVDQVADKVCATMDVYPRAKRSSRVKDLVDLIVIAHTQTVELADLRAAIDIKRALSGIAPFTQLDIPDAWARTWRATAMGVPVAARYPLAAATRTVSAFIGPALDERVANATWNPDNLTWEHCIDHDEDTP